MNNLAQQCEIYTGVALQKIKPEDNASSPFPLRYLTCNDNTQLVNIESVNNPFQSKLETLLFLNEKSDYRSSGYIFKDISLEDADKLEKKFNCAFSSSPTMSHSDCPVNVYILAEVYHKSDAPSSISQLEKKLIQALDNAHNAYDFIEWKNIRSLTCAQFQQPHQQAVDIDLNKSFVVSAIEDARNKFINDEFNLPFKY